MQPPSAAHPFGTDKFGRDQLSRVITGTRIDLSVGIVCTLIPAIIGVAVGSVAGYYGGKIDTLLMRIVDIQVAFPFYVLLIAILAILGPGTINIYYALILVGWIAFARLIRGEVLVAKHMEYVAAARTMGCSNARIIVRHLLPNIIGPTLVFAHVGGGAEYPFGGIARIPGPGGTGAASGVGSDGRGVTRVRLHRMVVAALPRVRHRAGRRRIQPARRWPVEPVTEAVIAGTEPSFGSCPSKDGWQRNGTQQWTRWLRRKYAFRCDSNEQRHTRRPTVTGRYDGSTAN